MAFIAEKKREKLIKRINKSYGFRKFLMVFEMLLLFGFIIMAFISINNANAGQEAWKWFINQKLTALGAGMLAWAIVMIVLGIISLILILTLKSPKSVTKDVGELESSALSGKKIKRGENSVKVYKDRTVSKKDKEKK